MKKTLIVCCICAVPWLLSAQVPPPPPPPGFEPYDTSIFTRYQLAFDSLAKAEDRMVEGIIRTIEAPDIHDALKIKLIMLLGGIDNEVAVKYLIGNIKKTAWIGKAKTPSFGNEGPTYMFALKYKKTLFALPFLCEFARSRCLDKTEIRHLTAILTYYISGPLNLDPQWVLYAAKGNFGDRNNPCVVKNLYIIIKHLKELRSFDY